MQANLNRKNHTNDTHTSSNCLRRRSSNKPWIEDILRTGTIYTRIQPTATCDSAVVFPKANAPSTQSNADANAWSNNFGAAGDTTATHTTEPAAAPLMLPNRVLLPITQTTTTTLYSANFHEFYQYGAEPHSLEHSGGGGAIAIWPIGVATPHEPEYYERTADVLRTLQQQQQKQWTANFGNCMQHENPNVASETVAKNATEVQNFHLCNSEKQEAKSAAVKPTLTYSEVVRSFAQEEPEQKQINSSGSFSNSPKENDAWYSEDDTVKSYKRSRNLAMRQKTEKYGRLEPRVKKEYRQPQQRQQQEPKETEMSTRRKRSGHKNHMSRNEVVDSYSSTKIRKQITTNDCTSIYENKYQMFRSSSSNLSEPQTENTEHLQHADVEQKTATLQQRPRNRVKQVPLTKGNKASTTTQKRTNNQNPAEQMAATASKRSRRRRKRIKKSNEAVLCCEQQHHRRRRHQRSLDLAKILIKIGQISIMRTLSDIGISAFNLLTGILILFINVISKWFKWN